MHKSPRLLSIGRVVLGFGGGQWYLERLLTHLSTHNFSVAVAVPEGPDLLPLIERLSGHGIACHQVPFDESTPHAAAILDKILRDFDPDILHVNDAARATTDAVLRMETLRHHRAKRVLTMHLPIVTDSMRSRGLRSRIPFGWVWRKRRRIRQYVSLFDKVMSVSRSHADSLRSMYGLPPDFIEVIPNGVDTNVYSPSPAGISDSSTVVIGGSGNLVEMKRFDLLIRAVKSLVASHSVRLVIAGSGPEEAALTRLIAELGLGNVVELVGYQRDVATFLRSLDIFAMTSDSEGLPYAALEAMAVGLPSVVTDVGDLPVAVRHDVEGFVVPRGDLAAFSQKLGSLIENKALRVSMGESARRRACAVYSEAVSLERTLAVIQRLGNQAPTLASR